MSLTLVEGRYELKGGQNKSIGFSDLTQTLQAEGRLPELESLRQAQIAIGTIFRNGAVMDSEGRDLSDAFDTTLALMTDQERALGIKKFSYRDLQKLSEERELPLPEMGLVDGNHLVTVLPNLIEGASFEVNNGNGGVNLSLFSKGEFSEKEHVRRIGSFHRKALDSSHLSYQQREAAGSLKAKISNPDQDWLGKWENAKKEFKKFQILKNTEDFLIGKSLVGVVKRIHTENGIHDMRMNPKSAIRLMIMDLIREVQNG